MGLRSGPFGLQMLPFSASKVPTSEVRGGVLLKSELVLLNPENLSSELRGRDGLGGQHKATLGPSRACFSKAPKQTEHIVTFVAACKGVKSVDRTEIKRLNWMNG